MKTLFPLATIFLITLATVALGADKNVDIAELDDVLAKVNGKSVYKADVYPTVPLRPMSLEHEIRPRISRYIDSLLVTQAAVAERLDRTATYRKKLQEIEQTATMSGNTLLARQYQEKITAPQDDIISDSDAAAYAKDNIDQFRGKTRRMAIVLARADIARNRQLGASFDWMTQTLGNQAVAINGEAIPASEIAAAIDAADRRYWKPESLLLQTVSDMVIAQEAKATGENAEAIKQDTDRIRALIAAAELTVAGNSFTLGNNRRINSVLSRLDLTKISKMQPVFLELITDTVMADMARAEGIDKDESYQSQMAQGASFRTHLKNKLLIELYREKHLDADAPSADFEALVSELRDNARIKYLLD